MRIHDDVRALGRIVEVRRIQRLAAEMQVADAVAAIHQLEGSRGENLDRLWEQEASWSREVSGGRFNLHLASVWSSAISIGEATIRQLSSRIDDAEDNKKRRCEDLHVAIARADAAEDLAKAASRRLTRLRDEASLAEMADRAARRGKGR